LSVKVTRGQKVKIVLRLTQFKTVAESRRKNCTSLVTLTFLNSSKYDYDRKTVSFKDFQRQVEVKYS